ncbi:MAG: response regulator [Armatimonadota bacterium]
MPSARILLVEDDPEQAVLFRQVLKLAGYDIVTAPDAETAVDLVAASDFDLLLVDWDLPGMKGDVFIGEMRGRYPQLKTVLYSNHTHVDEAARACGADAWLRKSEGIIRLRAVIAELLNGGTQ